MNISELHIYNHLQTISSNKEILISKAEEFFNAIKETISNKGKILIIGNGGSAADSQHFAAEFTGRYVKERSGLPMIALTTDSSALTAIGNDYGIEHIFSKQVSAIGRECDLLIGISTSGNSVNIIEAFKVAKEKNIKCYSMLGRDGGLLKNLSDNSLIIKSQTTAYIQETHILFIHLICNLIDLNYD